MDVQQVILSKLVPSEAICGLCHRVILPSTLVQCTRGHLFCEPCIRKHLQSHSHCPNDEDEDLTEDK